ncbi:MAG TPA: hypothetical protein DCL35_04775 [Candidatus Omnitrophica bacterium]|nr:hypothetical protein [Candidatus Omnitrophota bacterium]
MKRFFLLLLFFIAAQSLCSASEVTLEELLDKAGRDNPQIAAAKERYEASKARIPQASALDDPRVDFKYDNMIPRMANMDAEDPGVMRTFGISQEVPFPTKLLLRAQIAAKESQIVYAQFKEKENEIVSRVKGLFSELAWIYKAIDIVRENKILLEQLEKAASARFSLNKVSQQDVLKAQLEIAKMDNELIMLEQKRQVSQAKLNILLNNDPSEELGRPYIREDAAFSISLQQLNSAAKKYRRELEAFRLAVDRGRKTLSLAKQGYLPDFMFRYERMERSSALKEWAGMVGITIPLWFWQKQNFNVKEMKHELKTMEAMYRDKENEVLLEVKDFYAQLEAMGKLAELFRTAYLPQADQSLKAALSGYESAQTDFLNVLDSVRMLLDFKLDYYRTLIDFAIAQADLERAVGRDIEVVRGEQK